MIDAQSSKVNRFSGLICIFGYQSPPIMFDFYLNDSGSPYTKTFVGYDYIKSAMKLLNYERLVEQKSLIIFKKISTFKQKTMGDYEVLNYCDYGFVYLHNTKKYNLVHSPKRPEKIGMVFEDLNIVNRKDII